MLAAAAVATAIAFTPAGTLRGNIPGLKSSAAGPGGVIARNSGAHSTDPDGIALRATWGRLRAARARPPPSTTRPLRRSPSRHVRLAGARWNPCRVWPCAAPDHQTASPVAADQEVPSGGSSVLAADRGTCPTLFARTTHTERPA